MLKLVVILFATDKEVIEKLIKDLDPKKSEPRINIAAEMRWLNVDFADYVKLWMEALKILISLMT